MKIHTLIFTVALLLSNCTYHTYVVPPPKPKTPVRTVTRTTSHSHTSPDDFQAVTKPSTYSR